jgi:hypothetical protein
MKIYFTFIVSIWSSFVFAQASGFGNLREKLDAHIKTYNSKIAADSEAARIVKKFSELNKGGGRTDLGLEDEFISALSAYNAIISERDRGIANIVNKYEPASLEIWNKFFAGTQSTREALLSRKITYADYFSQMRALGDIRVRSLAEVKKDNTNTVASDREGTRAENSRGELNPTSQARRSSASNIERSSTFTASVKEAVDWAKLGIDVKDYTRVAGGFREPERTQEQLDLYVMERLLERSRISSPGTSNDLRSLTKDERNLAAVQKYMYSRLEVGKNFTGSLSDGREGALNFYYYGARAFGKWCFLEFSIINKLGYDLINNSIRFSAERARIYSSGYVDFDKISNNGILNFWIMHRKPDACLEGDRPRSGFGLFNNLEMMFADEEKLVKQGLKSFPRIAYSHGSSGQRTPELVIKSQFNQILSMQDPVVRELANKRNACFASCQSKMEACVLQYSSQQAANQICGLPSANCMATCDSIK